MADDGYTLLGRDELERMEGSGNCDWRLARKSLGLEAFGINLVEIGPGGQIPEHDETERDHEEVFIVWEGDATAVLDGEDRPAPEGTFVRVSPQTRRTIRNGGDGTVRLLVASAPRSSGYESMGWG
jgi:quercetin dioxygenase-like cupin family protein